MCANSEGSGEIARMCRLAWAFAGCLYDKYHMTWAKIGADTAVKNLCFSNQLAMTLDPYRPFDQPFH